MPDDVRRARQAFERANQANREILEPLIDAHLTAYGAALAELEGAHRLVADETALELDGATREAALWLLTGRGIGLARAAHDLAGSGYTVEMIPVLRSLHESTRLLTVFAHPGEEALVLRWLQGRNVPRGDIMAAIRRQEETARVDMVKEGVRPPETTSDYFEGQYGRWSEFAHHRRRHLLNQASVPARVMAAGRHPDWRTRAATVDHLGWYIVELVSVGGSALARLLGAEWFHERFQPTFRALLQLKGKIPLAEVAAGQAKSSGAPEAGSV
jgi:hypothetical protein